MNDNLRIKIYIRIKDVLFVYYPMNWTQCKENKVNKIGLTKMTRTAQNFFSLIHFNWKELTFKVISQKKKWMGRNHPALTSLVQI
jgi:hypothetical protein